MRRIGGAVLVVLVVAVFLAARLTYGEGLLLLGVVLAMLGYVVWVHWRQWKERRGGWGP